MQTIAFDAATAYEELQTFRAWLSARTCFGETEVVGEIRLRPQMACLLAYTILMPTPDRFQFEFGILGMFRADFLVGNDKARKFVLVEFEDGQADSLFKGGPKQYRHWSRRLEHGFGQVLDWAWARHVSPTNVLYANAFEGKVADICYVVVCGRNPTSLLEEQRLDFRRVFFIDWLYF